MVLHIGHAARGLSLGPGLVLPVVPLAVVGLDRVLHRLLAADDRHDVDRIGDEPV